MRWTVVTLTAALGCGSAEFNCEDSTQCVAGARSGRCESNGYCSFPDNDCGSGHRFGEHAGDNLAGVCVDGTPPIDDQETPPPLAICGNGIVEGAEVCDGEDFGELTCAALGYASGMLVCASACDGVDSTNCVAAACRQQGEECMGPEDCCNSGCGKNGSSCSVNGVTVCCS